MYTHIISPTVIMHLLKLIQNHTNELNSFLRHILHSTSVTLLRSSTSVSLLLMMKGERDEEDDEKEGRGREEEEGGVIISSSLSSSYLNLYLSYQLQS